MKTFKHQNEVVDELVKLTLQLQAAQHKQAELYHQAFLVHDTKEAWEASKAADREYDAIRKEWKEVAKHI